MKNVIVCGKKSVYIYENVSEDEYLYVSKYYYVLKRVLYFENINDDIFKFFVSFFVEYCFVLLSYLKSIIGFFVMFVLSGYGDIDLIIFGFYKVSGI